MGNMEPTIHLLDRTVEKSVDLRRTNVSKNVTVYRFYGVIQSQFLRAIFSLTPPKSINRRAEAIDELERNWREEKRLIDEKSINNRRTEAERSTRRAETIVGLKRNGRLEQQKQSTD